MKNLLLSALTVSLLALTACGGVATPVPSAGPTSPSVPAQSPVQAPAAGQALLSTLHYTAVPGLRIEIGQAFYTPVSTVVLK